VRELPPLPTLFFNRYCVDHGSLLAVARTWRAMRDEGVTPERLAAWRAALDVLREGKPRRGV
jgi:hypothetical protein